MNEIEEDCLCIECSEVTVNAEDGIEMCAACLAGNSVEIY
jgi:hypothetical protein